MRVGDHDMRHRLAPQRVEKRIAMRWDIRPRIDHGDLAVADDVAAGAREGERAAVAGNDPADAKAQAETDARRHGGCVENRVLGRGI